MISSDLARIEFQPRKLKALPGLGQRLQVTAQKAGELWQDSRRLRYRAGDVYTGEVTGVGADGLIDLRTDDGEELRIYSRDKAFELKVLD
jgi:hypothetical protein